MGAGRVGLDGPGGGGQGGAALAGGGDVPEGKISQIRGKNPVLSLFTY